MKKSTKKWLITATILSLAGCIMFGGIMSMFKWNFKKLSTVSYETNEYEIEKEFRNISITTDTANITLEPSKDAKTRVVCFEESKMKHLVEVQNDTLEIKAINDKEWYDYINIDFQSPKITLYLNEAEYSTLAVKVTTGKIEIKNGADFTSIDASVTTGDVNITSVTCSGDVKIETTTGGAKITDMKCKSFIRSGSTGKTLLKNVIASEKISINKSTGNVVFDKCDAAEIAVKTTTGSVKGSFVSDKVFNVSTSTGKIDVPKTVTGGKCEIKTTTGNILISISKE